MKELMKRMAVLVMTAALIAAMLPAFSESVFAGSGTALLEAQSEDVQVQEVSDMIRNLPDPGSVTLSDESAVNAAWNAYSSLTSEQKQSVDPDLVAKLTADEVKIKALVEQKAAEEAQNAAGSTEIIRVTPQLKLSWYRYTYSNKVCKPSVTVTAHGIKLDKSCYTLVYDPGCKKAGIYEVYALLKGKYEGIGVTAFEIKPKNVAKPKLTPKKNSLVVKMKEKVSATGAPYYQISYRKKDTSKWSKPITTKKQTYTIKGLKKGKKYEVRVRAYTDHGGDVYSAKWSKIKRSGKIK